MTFQFRLPEELWSSQVRVAMKDFELPHRPQPERAWTLTRQT